MDASQVIIGGFMSLISYGVIVFIVFKIVMISRELAEVKEILSDMKRNAEHPLLGAYGAHVESPAPLIQAVNAASYSTAEIDSASEIGKQ